MKNNKTIVSKLLIVLILITFTLSNFTIVFSENNIGVVESRILMEAADPLVYEAKSIRSVVDIVGVDKILFGSDFPLLIYPKVCREKNFQLFITDIRQNADLNGEE